MTTEEMRELSREYLHDSLKAEPTAPRHYHHYAILSNIWLAAAEICERLGRIEAKGKGEAK